jgi:hypothetical protein
MSKKPEPDLFARRSSPRAATKKKRAAEAAAARFQQSYQRLLPKDPVPPRTKGKP